MLSHCHPQRLHVHFTLSPPFILATYNNKDTTSTEKHRAIENSFRAALPPRRHLSRGKMSRPLSRRHWPRDIVRLSAMRARPPSEHFARGHIRNRGPARPPYPQFTARHAPYRLTANHRHMVYVVDLRHWPRWRLWYVRHAAPRPVVRVARLGFRVACSVLCASSAHSCYRSLLVPSMFRPVAIRHASSHRARRGQACIASHAASRSSLKHCRTDCRTFLAVLLLIYHRLPRVASLGLLISTRDLV